MYFIIILFISILLIIISFVTLSNNNNNKKYLSNKIIIQNKYTINRITILSTILSIFSIFSYWLYNSNFNKVIYNNSYDYKYLLTTVPITFIGFVTGMIPYYYYANNNNKIIKSTSEIIERAIDDFIIQKDTMIKNLSDKSYSQIYEEIKHDVKMLYNNLEYDKLKLSGKLKIMGSLFGVIPLIFIYYIRKWNSDSEIVKVNNKINTFKRNIAFLEKYLKNVPIFRKLAISYNEKKLQKHTKNLVEIRQKMKIDPNYGKPGIIFEYKQLIKVARQKLIDDKQTFLETYKLFPKTKAYYPIRVQFFKNNWKIALGLLCYKLLLPAKMYFVAQSYEENKEYISTLYNDMKGELKIILQMYEKWYQSQNQIIDNKSGEISEYIDQRIDTIKSLYKY